MSQLDDAKAEVARLEKQEALEAKLAAAGEAHEADPSEKTLAAHNKAAEALVEHRASFRHKGVNVGGDAASTPADEVGE